MNASSLFSYLEWCPRITFNKETEERAVWGNSNCPFATGNKRDWPKNSHPNSCADFCGRYVCVCSECACSERGGEEENGAEYFCG